MEFFATNGKRPVRLCEQTRQFAADSLAHRYGVDTWENQGIAMDDYPGFDQLSPLEQYDAAIAWIAEKAPIRICEHEKISGAATLGMAITHNIPVTWHGEKVFSSSVSHLTIDFETVLKEGIDAIFHRAQKALVFYAGTEKEPFARSCVHCLESMQVWHRRYLEALCLQPAFWKNHENLKNVPFRPAENFHEAVQSIWFTFAFVRLCGNWPGIGRLDWLLGEYLENDLKTGRLTLDEAREILAHFFIKGCEWVRGGCYGSGDAQHYQNILLGGVDVDGREVANPVTYLVLDVLEELGISDFPTTVRVNRQTDEALLTRMAEVIRLGGGTLAVYNEELILRSLTNSGYPLKEARKFANDGCWEVQIPGKTCFSYLPFDGLQILQQNTLDACSGARCFTDFDALYKQYVRDLRHRVFEMIQDVNTAHFSDTSMPMETWKWTAHTPCTVVSLFEQGCIEKGLSYLEGGPVYHVISPHIGGLPDVVNSLYAIKKLVFDEKKVAFSELMTILRNNWQDAETLRQYTLNRYVYFGNDNDEVDAIAGQLVADFAAICAAAQAHTRYQTPAGISTFGRQLEWSPARMATGYGKKAHEILAGNFSPTPGTDKEGATAIIRSYCKADLSKMVSGAALDIRLLPAAVDGENGVEAIMALIRGFVASGGHFMQLDIADTALLKAAQAHPEEYQSLSVRVSGWNARFVTLDREWQDMIIAQAGCEL